MELHIITKWFDKFPKEKEYFEKVADKSLFPIVDFEKKKIKANPLHKKILDFGQTFEEKMGLIKKYICAYVTDDDQPFQTERVKDLIVIFKVTPSLSVTSPFMHGWYSPKTREALEGAIQYYQPRTVVELGVWYGKSTVGMFQASKRKLDYYGFDFFSPTAGQPSYVTKTPLDKLFIEHFRFETAVANVAPYSKKHNIHFLIHNVMESQKIMAEMDIIPDLVFIDAIKVTKELQKVIDSYLRYNPDVVIVGDDYIYPTVKNAVRKYPQVVPFGNHAYVLTNREIPEEFPKPVSDFSMYPQLHLTKKEIKRVPKEMMGYVKTD